MNKTIAHVAIINSGKGVVGLVHKAIGMFRLSGAAYILYFVSIQKQHKTQQRCACFLSHCDS